MHSRLQMQTQKNGQQFKGHTQYNNFIITFYAFIAKRTYTVFNNCNINIQYLPDNLQKIKKIYTVWFVQKGGKTLVEK